MIRAPLRYAWTMASLLGGAALAAAACGSETVIDVPPNASDHDAGADSTSRPVDGPADTGLEPDVQGTEDVGDGFETEMSSDGSGPGDDASDGSCPSPAGGFVTLSSGGSPYGIAVTETDLFWADLGGKVLRMSLSDCSITTLASGQNGTLGITLAGDHVYFSNNGGGAAGSIATVPQAGGTVTTLASGLGSPGPVTNDGTNLYWTPSTNDYEGIYKMALTGGTVTSLASEGYSHDILTTNGLVYWTDQFGGSVAYVPVGGGTAVTVAADQPIPYFLASDGKNLYWTNSTGSDGGAVMKVGVGVDGGTPFELAAAPDAPTGVTSDGTNVYFGNGPSQGVLKVGVDGGAVTTLVAGPTSVNRITVDSKNVYWTDYAHGLVLMTSK
jgi:hypothetical protein